MLVNEILSDPLLTNYSCLMIDDIHERTVSTDIILGLIKKIRRKRPELKIILSSATIDSEELFSFFNEEKFKAHILYIKGRCFPVDQYYLKYPCKNYVLKAV